MNSRQDQTEEEFIMQLTKIYGPILPSRVLWQLLGYSSPQAFRNARAKGVLPVPEFSIEGRRSRFALTADVAKWIYQLKTGKLNEENKLNSL